MTEPPPTEMTPSQDASARNAAAVVTEESLGSIRTSLKTTTSIPAAFNESRTVAT